MSDLDHIVVSPSLLYYQNVRIVVAVAVAPETALIALIIVSMTSESVFRRWQTAAP